MVEIFNEGEVFFKYLTMVSKHKRPFLISPMMTLCLYVYAANILTILGFHATSRPCWCIEQWRKNSLGNLILLLCKT